MKLIEDMNNKPQKHIRKNEWWSANGVEVIRQRLPVGDYILVNDKVQDVLDRKAARGIPVKMMDLMGTYNIAVDSKRGCEELISCICGKEHQRFRDECILAQNNGIKLIILVENAEGYADKGHKIWNKCIRDVSELHSWTNPRLCLFRNGKQLYPTATRGITLQKACMTMQQKYGVEFLFCHHNESAEKILDLLGGE